MTETFTALGLSKPIIKALKKAGYIRPTEIQEKTIPIIIDGTDILASAQTGSGKTAAFALPTLDCLQEPEGVPVALVLVPTRELAIQVEEQFNLYSSYTGHRSVTIYGGTGYGNQLKALRAGVDVIIATPGRLLDYMQQGAVDLSNVEILILDEADRLLDMGFIPQVRRIITKLSKERQTLMFSATIDRRIEYLANEFLNDPTIVKVNSDQIEPEKIDQRIFRINEFSKDALLAKLIKEMNMESVLIFTETKRKATWVKDRLRDAQIPAEEIHGDVAQNQREKTLSKFRDGSFTILVATDVAARGLDIPSISHVVNYDLPNTPEDYVHRIGRTGRAGRSGVAISFVSQEQSFLLKDIEKIIGRPLEDNSSEGAGTAAKKVVPRRFNGRRRRA